MLRTIIVEDEINVRKGFIKLLATFCPEVEIIGEASSIEEGLQLIHDLSFDLLFLDINLPDGSGFDLLHQLSEIDFHIVFVTAYNQYAIDAFKLSAVDYLLKPIEPELLKKAISKVRKLIPDSNLANRESLEIIQHHIDQNKNQENKIILRDQEGMQLLKIKDIIYCMAEGSYTSFIINSGAKVTTSTHLKEYDHLLKPYHFVRCHHSYLVNLTHVTKLVRSEGGYLIMSDQSQLPISLRKKSAIIEEISKLFIG
jgi:two-component system LytT family response regulator